MNDSYQDKQDRRLGVAVIAGTVAVVSVTAYVIHRRKVNNVIRGMQLLMEDEIQVAYQDGYDEAIHRFIQGRLAGNLSKLNNLAAQYPA